jgi:hypothetical protein
VNLCVMRNPTWMPIAFTLAVFTGGCGAAQIERPPHAVWCPKGVATAHRFDAREALGLREARAVALARKAGCGLTVMRRDDQQFATTANYDPRRLKVEVDDGIVTRLIGVN